VARGDPDPQRHRPDSEPQRWAEVYRLAVNPGVHWFWGGYLPTRRAPYHLDHAYSAGHQPQRNLGRNEDQDLRDALDAGLGLHASGGDRVGQCRVVAFVLVGVGLGEVGHGLVELV
jgi:hypothetical protein